MGTHIDAVLKSIHNLKVLEQKYEKYHTFSSENYYTSLYIAYVYLRNDKLSPVERTCFMHISDQQIHRSASFPIGKHL